MSHSTLWDQDRSFCCQGNSNIMLSNFFWWYEVVEAVEAVEATEVIEAVEVIKAADVPDCREIIQ